MIEIKYQHAYNEKNEIVNINDVDIDYRSNHTFHCIECGKEMIARLGEKNKHHFAHKSTEICDPSHYLHTLAELLIKKRFDSKGLSIVLSQIFYCSRKDECAFFDKQYGDCSTSQESAIDLRSLYDICTVEKSIGPYIADLLLENTKNPEIEPILLEIKVTHACTKEKITSNYKIIEITIQNEEQILEIAESGCLRESSYNSCIESPIIFFNKAFPREVYDKMDLTGKHLIHRFILYQSNSCFLKTITCKDIPDKCFPSKSLLEMNIIAIEGSNEFWSKYADKLNGNLDICLLDAVDQGYNIRNCKLCKYHRYYADFYSSDVKLFCCLHKKFNLNKFPKQTDAQNCDYYSLDKHLVERVFDELTKYDVEVFE